MMTPIMRRDGIQAIYTPTARQSEPFDALKGAITD